MICYLWQNEQVTIDFALATVYSIAAIKKGETLTKEISG